jgi:CheY-like chemotaxis protein
MTTSCLPKILVVDDDEDSRFMMSEFLDSLGYDHDVLPDGAVCVDTLKRNPHTYALILMDIHMPGVSGVEASRRVRQISNDPPRDIPIVGVTADTAYSDHRDPQRAFGINRMMAKPVRLTELDETIHDFVWQRDAGPA